MNGEPQRVAVYVVYYDQAVGTDVQRLFLSWRNNAGYFLATRSVLRAYWFPSYAEAVQALLTCVGRLEPRDAEYQLQIGYYNGSAVLPLHTIDDPNGRA